MQISGKTPQNINTKRIKLAHSPHSTTATTVKGNTDSKYQLLVTKQKAGRRKRKESPLPTKKKKRKAAIENSENEAKLKRPKR